MAYLCYCCNKVLSNIAVDRAWAVVYDKCKGRKCPNCGKTRKTGSIKITLFNGGASDICPKCGKSKITAEFSSSSTQGVCRECFWEDEREKGCVCIHDLCKWDRYYCPLCRDVHVIKFKCKECAGVKGVVVRAGGKLFRVWQIIIPSVFSGVIIGIIIGFIIAKIVLKKKQPKKKFTP